jgi:hypothetical protein
MDARTAKREACWRIASATRSTLHNGWDLGEDYPDPADAAKVEAQMAIVLEELERRGHK